jgi:hypothetical protein
MKIAAILSVAITMLAQAADQSVFLTTANNAKISCAPNGPLDGPVMWTSTGPNALTNPDNLTGLVTCSLPGTNVVTMVAMAGGSVISNTVAVVVTTPIPPATTLGVKVAIVSK